MTETTQRNEPISDGPEQCESTLPPEMLPELAAGVKSISDAAIGYMKMGRYDVATHLLSHLSEVCDLGPSEPEPIDRLVDFLTQIGPHILMTALDRTRKPEAQAGPQVPGVGQPATEEEHESAFQALVRQVVALDEVEFGTLLDSIREQRAAYQRAQKKTAKKGN